MTKEDHLKKLIEYLEALDKNITLNIQECPRSSTIFNA
jgi:hypothetical protein